MARRFGRCGLASALLRLSAFFLFVSPFVAANFFQPAKRGEVWTVGDVIDLQYHTTMANYTIALWQETRPNTKQTRPVLGPILFRTEKGPDTGFPWAVKLYDFDLESSNVFFFWLKHGGPANQKNMKERAVMSSFYFRIQRKKPPGESSTASTTSLEGIPTAPSSSPPLSTDAASPTEAPSPDTSGLPVGAQAGIGVGVSVFGLVCIFCAVLWFRYIKKKRRLLTGLDRNTTPSEPPPMDDSWKPPFVPPTQACYYPVEMDTGRQAAEMPGYQGGAPHSAELPGDNSQAKGYRGRTR